MKEDKKSIRIIAAVLAFISILIILILILKKQSGIYVWRYYPIFRRLFNIWESIYVFYIVDIINMLFLIGVFVTLLMKKYTIVARILSVKYLMTGILDILQVFIFDGSSVFSSIPYIVRTLISIIIGILLLVVSLRKKSADFIVIICLVIYGIWLVYDFWLGDFYIYFIQYLVSATLVISVICLFITSDFEEKKAVEFGNTLFSFQKENVELSIILSIITCGIYGIVWLVKIVKNVHKLHGNENESVVSEVLLILFIPFYISYWMYKNGIQMYEDSLKCGGNIRNNSVMYTILALFGLGIIDYALIQKDFNEFEVGKNTFDYNSNRYVQQNTSESVTNTLTELQKLKEAGLITENEFIEKRKEILDRL